MPKATLPNGDLVRIDNCYITIPGTSGDQGGQWFMDNLPDISDSKSASYADEPIIGRSFPLKTYSHSENRQISWTIHLFTRKQADITRNLQFLRALESAVYPREGRNNAPFVPPPVCKLRCGKLLTEEEDVCCVLKSYSVKFPIDVAWDPSTLLPSKFDIDTTWEAVYRSSDLPGQRRIMLTGR